MSVIVMGMEMPKEGTVIAIYKLNGKVYASVHGTELCPVVPLPEKHGDLVDISQEVNIEYYDDMNQEWSWKAGTVADALVVCEEFPMTIVEAEGD